MREYYLRGEISKPVNHLEVVPTCNTFYGKQYEVKPKKVKKAGDTKVLEFEIKSVKMSVDLIKIENTQEIHGTARIRVKDKYTKQQIIRLACAQVDTAFFHKFGLLEEIEKTC